MKYKKKSSDSLIREVNRRTRRKFSADEKIRIGLKNTCS